MWMSSKSGCSSTLSVIRGGLTSDLEEALAYLGKYYKWSVLALAYGETWQPGCSSACDRGEQRGGHDRRRRPVHDRVPVWFGAT